MRAGICSRGRCEPGPRSVRSIPGAVPSARDGFSLVEVAVAAAILALATLGAVGLAWSAAREAGETDRRERLLWAAEGARDSLLSGELPAGSGERSLPFGATIRWNLGGVGGSVEGWVEDSLWIRLPASPGGADLLPGSR